MMNDSLNEYHAMRNFEYRRDRLMDEARRERLKASVLRRARQQGQSPRWLHVTTDWMAALRAWFRRMQVTDQPCLVDDCLESSPT